MCHNIATVHQVFCNQMFGKKWVVCISCDQVLRELLIYFWGQGYPITYVMESRTSKKFVKLVKMHVLYMMYLIRVHAGKHLSSVSE